MTVAGKNGLKALSLEIEFGGETAAWLQDGRPGLCLPLVRLGGETAECIFPAVRPAGEAHGFQLFAAGELLLGCGFQPVAGDAETAAVALYRRLLRAADRRPLCRIWNYVPAINALTNGLENYRAFNIGRARAFEEAFGAGYRHVLPAASAVGCRGEALAAVFAAGRRAPRHIENPEQIPAYHYPSRHGPSAPSFSRSTIVEEEGRRIVFISGTAAIKGDATVAPGVLELQLECTLDNLRLMWRAAGLGEQLGVRGGFIRHFKIYLRHASDLPMARGRLEGALLQPGDRIVWLQAEICRAELAIEIEATLVER